MRSRRTSSTVKLATLAVTAGFSCLALHGVHLARAWHALERSDYAWLAPALLVLALAMGARALRWRSLFAPDRRPPLGAIANAMMLGYFYNNIMPARAGEVARVLVLSRRSRARPVEIAGTAALERVYDVVGVLVIFFLALPWLPRVSWLEPAAIVAGGLAVAIAATALVLATRGERAVRALLRPLRRLPGLSEERLARVAADVTYGFSGLRHPRVAVCGLFWTLVAWLLTALLAYLVSVAFALHLPFACGVLVTVAVGLAMILPSPPAAVGVFEGAALIGLRAYGLSQSAALPYALVLHLVNFLPFVVVGVPLLHRNARRARADAPAGSARSAPPAPPASAPARPRSGDYVPRFAGRQAAPAAGVALARELAAAQPETVQLQAREHRERLGAVYDGGPHADG